MLIRDDTESDWNSVEWNMAVSVDDTCAKSSKMSVACFSSSMLETASRGLYLTSMWRRRQG